MKIDYLHIRSQFKNLKDVCIDFAENSLMTVIVGRNGSGKSNVLEALVAIFRNLDLGEQPDFSYELHYILGEGKNATKVLIDADPERGTISKQYQVKVSSSNGELFESEKIIPFSKVKCELRANS